MPLDEHNETESNESDGSSSSDVSSDEEAQQPTNATDDVMTHGHAHAFGLSNENHPGHSNHESCTILLFTEQVSSYQ